MTDVYDEAVAKIAACEKASAEKAEVSVNVGEILSDKNTIFLPGDYDQGLSILDRMILKAADNIQVAAGDEVPIAGPKQQAVQQQNAQHAAAAQQMVQQQQPSAPRIDTQKTGKQLSGFLGGLQGNIMKIGNAAGSSIGGLTKTTEQPQPIPAVQRVPPAIESYPAPDDKTQPKPHIELGKMIGNINNDINNAIINKAAPEDNNAVTQPAGRSIFSLGAPQRKEVVQEALPDFKEGPPQRKDEVQIGRLAKLSIPDQIAELERASLTLYQKTGSRDWINNVKEELKSLAVTVKTEDHSKDSDFDKKLVELRDERLREAMGLAGIIQ